ncbi:Nucleoporin POM33 [Candida viswanathii]|uniref:Nucleoporin POM33 n=1 Tax=Candida viswanathii TaxID=5486 RepID=A0A367XQ52_9ASCO|nr:Nucleoporin POM33 [Candida viswanathii]
MLYQPPTASATYNLRRQPRLEALDDLFKTQQFYWFVCQVCTILFFVSSIVIGVIDPPVSLRYYQYCLASIILSYVLVIIQIYPKSGIMSARFRLKLIRDHNIQYLLLALVLFSSSFEVEQIRSGLYSFVIYSMFHVSSYVQKYLSPIFLTTTRDQQRFNSILMRVTCTLNHPALFLAAISEIVTLLISAFRLITCVLFLVVRWNLKYVMVQFAVLAVLVVFVKLRYDDNQCTYTVVNLVDTRIDDIVNQVNDPQLLYCYYCVRDGGIKYLSWIQLSGH